MSCILWCLWSPCRGVRKGLWRSQGLHTLHVCLSLGGGCGYFGSYIHSCTYIHPTPLAYQNQIPTQNCISFVRRDRSRGASRSQTTTSSISNKRADYSIKSSAIRFCCPQVIPPDFKGGSTTHIDVQYIVRPWLIDVHEHIIVIAHKINGFCGSTFRRIC